MGTKFANLQILCNDASAIKKHCPHDTVVQLTQNWITVVGENITWGTAQKEAKKLSKLLPFSILSTEYFDDDYVEISAYKDGKCVAKHIPVSYEGFSRKIGKPVQFIEAFSLQNESETQLKVVFQENVPEKCVHLLECVLDCVLWVNQDNISNAVLPADTYLTEYLANRKKKQTLKNITKLALLDEVSGDFDHEVTYPIVRYETPTGELKSVWSISSENHFFKLFQTDIKGRIATNSASVFSDKKFLLTVNEWNPQKIISMMYIFNYSGGILNKIACDNAEPCEVSLLNEDLLFCNGKCHELGNGKVKWDWENAHCRIERVCKITDSKFAAVYDLNNGDTEKAYISIFNIDGIIEYSLELPSVYHWKFPIVYDDKIFIACGVSKSASILYCYDCKLNEKWSISYPGIYHHAEPFIDKESEIIYYQATAFSIHSLNVNEQCIKVKRNISDCYAKLFDVVAGVGVVAITGDKVFELWNKELQTISRHRTKGIIMRMVHMNDKHYILSNCHGDWENKDNGEKNHTGSIQLYELKLIQK